MKGITLEQLLQSRDVRHQKQIELLKKYPNDTLICLTVIMPGSIKRNSSSLFIANKAVQSLKEAFEDNIVYLLENDFETGYEAFLITTTDTITAKKIVCEIEENHPLGRLFDIDVIDHNGVPIQREAVGRDKRKCLLCDNEARYCMRNHTHTTEEIIAKINQMIADYV